MTIADWLGQLKILDYEVNILQYASLLTHYFGLVYTPLSREIVELSSKRIMIADRSPVSIFHDDPGSLDHRHARSTVGSKPWYEYLQRPKELIRLIKRYHVVGNWCIVSIIIHLNIAVYLWIKAILHPIYTGNDPKRAEFFASHYFPRLFESYPNQYKLYTIIGTQCSYILILRLYVIGRLIKRSIMNADGYKEVEMSQLNGVFIESFRWPLKEWFRICMLGLKHYRRCTGEHGDISNEGSHLLMNSPDHARTDLAEEEAHLYNRSWSLDHMIGSSGTYFLCKTNPIDFTRCYQCYNLKLNNDRRSALYYPAANCRMDLWELSWLVILVIYGAPVTISFMTMAAISNLLAELAVLSPNRFDSTLLDWLRQVPNLWTNANHLLRLIDSNLFFWMLSHHIFEQAVIHVDICALLSRIRKVNERFQAAASVWLSRSR